MSYKDNLINLESGILCFSSGYASIFTWILGDF